MRAALAVLIFAGLAIAVSISHVQCIDPAEARAIIDRHNADQFGGWFDPIAVLAIIEIESGFDPGAIRFEARLGESSRGLMQVLPSTARDRGLTTDTEAALFNPAVNILIGMRQLKWSFDFLAGALGRPPDFREWIGSYNAGVGAVLGGFIPTAYVNRWLAARSRLV